MPNTVSSPARGTGHKEVAETIIYGAGVSNGVSNFASS